MPETLIAVVTALFTVGALVLVGPLLALPCLVGVPLLWIGTRWYLRRARDGYLRENAAYVGRHRRARRDGRGRAHRRGARLERPPRARGPTPTSRGSYAAERYTLGLRTVWFPLSSSAT